MTTFDLADHRRRPGRRGRRVQGAASSGPASPSSTAAGSAGSCPHIGCLPSKSLLAQRRRARRRTRRATTGPRASAHRDCMINRPPDAAEPDDGGHVRGLEAAGATVYRGDATITGRGRVTVRHDGVEHELSGRQRRRRRRVGLQGAADPGPRGHPDLDQPRGDAGPRAAAQPARAGRRADRLRARPGLRPVRRADDDRPVRAAARPDRPPAQLRGGPRGPRARRGDGPDRRPGGRRARRRPATTARTSSTSTTARPPRATPSCWRSGASSRSTTSGWSTTASTRAGGRPSRATGGCASPTGCASSATRPARSCTPTRATTRASWRSGWRWARRSCPTTGPCPAPRTPTPRRRSSG